MISFPLVGAGVGTSEGGGVGTGEGMGLMVGRGVGMLEIVGELLGDGVGSGVAVIENLWDSELTNKVRLRIEM